MNINNIKSSLKMSNFYFSKCIMERFTPRVEDGEYDVDLEKEIEKIEDHLYRVTLTTTLQKEDSYVLIQAQADFVYESEERDISIEETVINTNTTAIMFPFIRSHICLMTAQPGMSPIVLPPIDTRKL